jgi:chorismate mutase
MHNDNPGPLENEAIIRLFERVIDESRRLERIRTKGI